MFVCQLLNKGQLQVSEKPLKMLTEKRSEEKRRGAHKLLDGNQWKKAVMPETAIVPILFVQIHSSLSCGGYIRSSSHKTFLPDP